MLVHFSLFLAVNNQTALASPTTLHRAFLITQIILEQCRLQKALLTGLINWNMWQSMILAG